MPLRTHARVPSAARSSDTASPKLPRRTALRWELGAALAVKAALLLLIWWLWFAAPVDERLDARAVGTAIIGTEPPRSPE